MRVCYLCNKLIDGSTCSRDHVIPQTLTGKGQPKRKGSDYAKALSTHADCNNRFGDETYVRKALQLWEILRDPDNMLFRPAPGNRNGRSLVLNEEMLPGFGPRDFQFFGIHDARNDPVTSFDVPEYYADKPRADFRKTVLCIVLSVLTKSAAALLVKRYLDNLPSKWNVFCVPGAGGARVELRSLFGETKPFARDIQVTPRRLEPNSWTVTYAVDSATVLFFFLMSNDYSLAEGIKERFDCLQFQGDSLMELVGHDWPPVRHTRIGA